MHPADVLPSSVAHSRKMDAGSLQHLSQGGRVGYLCIFVRARVSRARCEAAAGWLACPQRGRDGGDKALQQPLLLAAEGRGAFPETRGPAGCWGWKMWCECGCSDETLAVCLSPRGDFPGCSSQILPRLIVMGLGASDPDTFTPGQEIPLIPGSSPWDVRSSRAQPDTLLFTPNKS